MRSLSASGSVYAFCLLLAASPIVLRGPPARASLTSLSRINVAVYTIDGKPVSDLSAADFTIREGGETRTVASELHLVSSESLSRLPVGLSRLVSPQIAFVRIYYSFFIDH